MIESIGGGNFMEKNHGIRITKLETKMDNIEKKVDDFSDIAEAVTKLSLLSEQQIERNKKLDELYEKVIISNTEFGSTLKVINKNLTCMNDELINANKRISNLEDKMDVVNNKSKVDLLEVAKNWIPKLIAGGAIFYLLQLFKTIKIIN